MTPTPELATIQLRRGPAAQWTAANPVLAAGEPGFETDTGKHKIGDGTSTWSELAYFVNQNVLNSEYVALPGSSVAAGAVPTKQSGGSMAYAVPAGVTALPASRNARIATGLSALPVTTAQPVVGALSGAYYGNPGSTSSITSATNVNIFADGVGTSTTINSKFTPLGFPYYKRQNGIGETSNLMANLQAAAMPGGVEFIYTGSKCELVFWGDAGGYYRIWVDGAPLTPLGVPTGVTDGANHNLPITFPGGGPHLIRVKMSHGAGFGGVNIGPSDSVVASPALAPQLYVVGDSYIDGANGVQALDTWPHLLADKLGVRDLWVDGQGGTGLTANGGDGSAKNVYLTRLQADVALTRLSPAVAIIQGSTNDYSASSSSIQSALAACISQMRTSWPNALIVVTGVLVPVPASSQSSGNVTNNAALLTAATASSGGADIFIDPLAESWFIDNNDVFLSSDSVHPTPAGHNYIAKRIAALA